MNMTRVTHNVAAEIHRAMAKANLSIAELAQKIGESERFIGNILQGEDGMDRIINLRLLREIVDATGVSLTFKIYTSKQGRRSKTVKPDGRPQT